MTDNFTTALNGLGPFEPNPIIAVANSGGADSMACTLLADAWARTHGGRAIALSVDHGLRPESAAETTHIAAWMQARNIEHHILTPAHHAQSNNLSAAAREWRYTALTDWCRAHHVLHLLLGHHQHDQAETVALMHARGGQTDGLCGMAALRNHRGVRLLRPLLGCTKQTLTDYLHAQNQPWLEDPSNHNPKFARARMRNTLAQQPEQEAHALRLRASAATARAKADATHAEACYACIEMKPPYNHARLALTPWRLLPENAACRVLADMLRCLSGRHTRPRKAETLRLYQALQMGKPHTLYGYKITPHDSEYAEFSPETNAQPALGPNSIQLAPSRFYA